jgi:hypothetical protein
LNRGSNTSPESVSHFAFLESLLAGFTLEQAMDVGHGGSWHFGFTMYEVANTW